jgi:hypothetical protein
MKLKYLSLLAGTLTFSVARPALGLVIDPQIKATSDTKSTPPDVDIWFRTSGNWTTIGCDDPIAGDESKDSLLRWQTAGAQGLSLCIT